MAVREPEEIRVFGFSLDRQSFPVASSPSLMIFRRNGATASYVATPSLSAACECV